MSDADLREMVPVPPAGRVFRSAHRVRLGDVSPSGRMRLDAIARHLQDIATDDSRDAQLTDADAWVVRRTTLRVHHFPVHQQPLLLSTWCGAIGSHWAERRTRLEQEETGEVLVDTATLWVRIDATAMRPARVGEQFVALYGEAAGGRRISSRLDHDDPTAQDEQRGPWPLRFVDFDALGHVNNAAGWAVVEELLAERGELRPGHGAVLDAEVEHRRAIERGADPWVTARHGSGEVKVWLTEGTGPAGPVALSARLRISDPR